MIVQWFPGHMTKALRMMEENIALVESVVYVLDARAVISSINPSFDKFLINKNVLYAINKSDLADSRINDLWLKYFIANGRNVVVLNGSSNVSQLKVQLKKINEPIVLKYKERGAKKIVRAMVIGVPNSGKSTIINSLCGQKRTITGDKAGVTKGKQWVKVDDSLEVLDTPGTLCPSFDSEQIGFHLGYIGSINDMIIDRESLCLKFIEEMLVLYPEFIRMRYSVSAELTPIEIYEAVAQKRGYIFRGGDVDYERTATAIFDDFRKGRIGGISLDRP